MKLLFINSFGTVRYNPGDEMREPKSRKIRILHALKTWIINQSRHLPFDLEETDGQVL